jgi:hypothetical protein
MAFASRPHPASRVKCTGFIGEQLVSVSISPRITLVPPPGYPLGVIPPFATDRALRSGEMVKMNCPLLPLLPWKLKYLA